MTTNRQVVLASYVTDAAKPENFALSEGPFQRSAEGQFLAAQYVLLNGAGDSRLGRWQSQLLRAHPHRWRDYEAPLWAGD